jgi:hypothetical protein
MAARDYSLRSRIPRHIFWPKLAYLSIGLDYLLLERLFREQ